MVIRTNKLSKKQKIIAFVYVFLLLNLLLFITIGITFLIINHNLKYEMPEIINVELYDENNVKYLSYSNNRKQSYVKLSQINKNLINAFLSIEDKRFYEHRGVDIIRIGGAIIADLKKMSLAEGASTITQQYVRLLYLNSDKTIKRKLYEVMIAINLESKYSKDEILEGYLNAVYFDHGIYGVEDAAVYYFGKSAAEISLAEAAVLAAIPKGPKIYSPIDNYDNNLSRKELILLEMKNDNLITEEEYSAALKEEIELVGINPIYEDTDAPYYQDIVINELKSMGWLDKYLYEGLKVYTTLDLDLNKAITNSIKKRAPETGIQTSIVAMDPKSGAILSCIGGNNYNDSSYNRATNSLRQPGSTIKPFLYLSAIENGFTPATTFKSEPTTFHYKGETYSPNNFQNIYANTDVSMVYAIATSDNIYAMKTHLFLGPEVLAGTLKRFKFSSKIQAIPSLALGTNEVTLLELTAAYNTLASCGIYYEPFSIKKITTSDDKVLYERNINKKERIANSSNCYLLNTSMNAIFDNRITFNIRPTGARIASLLSHTYSGKSGSTDTDNWMMGFNPDITVGVWTGYDDNREIIKTIDASYGKYIWADAVESYLKDKKSTWYETPNDVIGVDLNPMTGFYPAIDEYYRKIYFSKNNTPWYVELLYRFNINA